MTTNKNEDLVMGPDWTAEFARAIMTQCIVEDLTGFEFTKENVSWWSGAFDAACRSLSTLSSDKKLPLDKFDYEDFCRVIRSRAPEWWLKAFKDGNAMGAHQYQSLMMYWDQYFDKANRTDSDYNCYFSPSKRSNHKDLMDYISSISKTKAGEELAELSNTTTGTEIQYPPKE
ncbi:hypothetical protein HYFRA_00003836 [Hymenoscyphus fraxineus]|uniref:Uncharacterized protein n=1 Tax=Hymenoscyphus fraxineus TaxID=746836 RepID=A0A9N9PR34_9HELO|nr:hypothetical protein HYFRA_00003836 [Hymenoscyphus fraxineus]